MFIETDLERIKKLSQKKEGENWGFRSFLKDCEIPGRKIDQVAQKLYKRVTDKIDCRTCANCCKEMEPLLTQGDVVKLSRGLNLSVGKVKKKYLEQSAEGEGFTFNQKPCPFLAGNLCSVYDSRPQDCFSYPHILRKGVANRLSSVIHNCSICPIVFNVLELLKEEIWTMDECDDDDDL